MAGWLIDSFGGSLGWVCNAFGFGGISFFMSARAVDAVADGVGGYPRGPAAPEPALPVPPLGGGPRGAGAAWWGQLGGLDAGSGAYNVDSEVAAEDLDFGARGAQSSSPPLFRTQISKTGIGQERRCGRRWSRHSRRMLAASFNANLSRARVEEFLEDEVVKLVRAGGAPVIAAQEHGKLAEWFHVSPAAQER